MKGLDSGVGRLREFGAPEMKTVGSCYRPWLGGNGGPGESWTQTGGAHPWQKVCYRDTLPLAEPDNEG